jgi:collagenase-like PrtC family protease
MQLRVSTNWDPELPKRLSHLQVSGLYGKLADDVIGGCRPSFLLPQVSREQVAAHVRDCHAAGLEFSYLLNTTCLNNIQYTRQGYASIRELVDWLAEIGVDSLTVAIPYLVRLIREHYPGFKLTISSAARVNSVTRARQFEDMGADEIIIDEMQNRDFATLQAMSQAVDCGLELIANPCCIWECPQQIEHVNHDGHASQTQSHNNYCYLQYPYLVCTSQKLLEPENIIKARWIRPEDLADYEALGIHSFKVVERFKTSQALCLAAEAYSHRSFDGNLVDLLTLPNRGSFLPPNLEYFNKPDTVDPAAIAPVAELMDFSFSDILNIPNKALDGFLDFFKEHDCRRLSCDSCGYCRSIFRQVAELDRQAAEERGREFADFAARVSQGRIF